MAGFVEIRTPGLVARVTTKPDRLLIFRYTFSSLGAFSTETATATWPALRFWPFLSDRTARNVRAVRWGSWLAVPDQCWRLAIIRSDTLSSSCCCSCRYRLRALLQPCLSPLFELTVVVLLSRRRCLLPPDLNVGVVLLDPVGHPVAPQRYELQRGFPNLDVLVLRGRDAGACEVFVLLLEE